MPQVRRFEGFQHSQVDVSSEPEPRKVDERALQEIILAFGGHEQIEAHDLLPRPLGLTPL